MARTELDSLMVTLDLDETPFRSALSTAEKDLQAFSVRLASLNPGFPPGTQTQQFRPSLFDRIPEKAFEQIFTTPFQLGSEIKKMERTLAEKREQLPEKRLEFEELGPPVRLNAMDVNTLEFVSVQKELTEEIRALESEIEELESALKVLKEVISRIPSKDRLPIPPSFPELDEFSLPPMPKPRGPDGSRQEDQNPRPLMPASSELDRVLGSASGGEQDGLGSVFSGMTQAGTESALALEEAFTQAGESIDAAFKETFTDIFTSGKLNFDKLKGAALGALDSILKKLLSIAAENVFGKIFGGGGGFFGKLLGGVGKALIGGKAGGGAVQPATPVLVGERGPEIFVPSTVGSIMPNSALGRGGGRPVVVNQSIRFDVGLETFDRRLMQAAGPIAAQAVAAVEEARERDFR